MGDGFSLGIICYTLTVLKIVATLVRDEFGFILGIIYFTKVKYSRIFIV